MDRARIALEFADAVECLRIAHNSLHEAEAMSIEATSDLSILIERNRSVKDMLTTKENEVQELSREVDKLNASAKQLLKQVTDIMSSDSDGSLREFFMSLPTAQTLEELDSEIESEKARLDLMHEGNDNTIREFEQRRRKIEILSSKLNDITAGLADLDNGIDSLRSKWEPELDGLVRKISDSFSYNMEQISCAGEVSIWKDDDFEQWAIQIRVKFRYARNLSTLFAPDSLLPRFFPTHLFSSAHRNQQRKRAPNNPNLPPPIRRRARSLNNLLPHVPAIPHALPFPRCRRNQSRYGSKKRTTCPQTYGGYRLRRCTACCERPSN